VEILMAVGHDASISCEVREKVRRAMGVAVDAMERLEADLRSIGP
jgi:hypothetical protein